jgi:hypothetical protein
MSGVTSIYVAYAGHNTCLDNRQSPNPQGGPGGGGHHRRLRVEWWVLPYLRHLLPRGTPLTFFSLMVGAPRPLAPPPRGVVIDVFYVDGGRS